MDQLSAQNRLQLSSYDSRKRGEKDRIERINEEVQDLRRDVSGIADRIERIDEKVQDLRKDVSGITKDPISPRK